MQNPAHEKEYFILFWRLLSKLHIVHTCTYVIYSNNNY